MVIFPTVQPLLDPTRGNAACTFSLECPGSHTPEKHPVSANFPLSTFQGHPYTPPSKSSLAWPVLSYCVFFLFHILVLQPVAFVLHVNLDFVLCPAPRYASTIHFASVIENLYLWFYFPQFFFLIFLHESHSRAEIVGVYQIWHALKYG